MIDLRTCEECEKVCNRNEMLWSRDCRGIEFRLLCKDCWEEVMENGYDGEYYDECDECLDYSEGW